jgi:hypothetical protein
MFINIDLSYLVVKVAVQPVRLGGGSIYTLVGGYRFPRREGSGLKALFELGIDSGA